MERSIVQQQHEFSPDPANEPRRPIWDEHKPKGGFIPPSRGKHNPANEHKPKGGFIAPSREKHQENVMVKDKLVLRGKLTLSNKNLIVTSSESTSKPKFFSHDTERETSVKSKKVSVPADPANVKSKKISTPANFANPGLHPSGVAKQQPLVKDHPSSQGDIETGNPGDEDQQHDDTPATKLKLQQFPPEITERQNAVREAMKWAWKGYTDFSWGLDELHPLSHKGDDWFGLGLTLIDALDTLFIMGLTEEFESARHWVETSLSFDNKKRFVKLQSVF